ASDEPGHPVSRRAPVPLRVSFRDADGRPTANTPATVSVRLVDGNGTVHLTGRATASVRDGEAAFGDLRVGGSGGFHLEVTGAGMPPARTRRLYAAMDGAVPDARVRLLGGTVNGQPVDSLRREVRVRPGEAIAGVVTFRTLTDVRDAAMLFGGVALWGDRRVQAHALQALPPHGAVTFREPLDDKITGHRWMAPRRPGRYAIVFGFDTETEMRFIASGTNWLLGTPRWNDGNDLADLSVAQLRQLERDGRLFRSATQLAGGLPRPASGAPSTTEGPRRFVATVLWVTVTLD
ncbi:MAG: hypothetical protein KJT01_09685, partial [Gemmatimonadetes bacterium]|nr:hypothetical protein [Gemmatimonadota bacterium]